MLTATHCLSTEGTDYSLDAGVDMIIHCNFDLPNGESKFDPKLTEKIVKKDVMLTLLFMLKGRFGV